MKTKMNKLTKKVKETLENVNNEINYIGDKKMNKNERTEYGKIDFEYGSCIRLLLMEKISMPVVMRNIERAVRMSSNEVTDIKGSSREDSPISYGAYEEMLKGDLSNLVLAHNIIDEKGLALDLINEIEGLEEREFIRKRMPNESGDKYAMFLKATKLYDEYVDTETREIITIIARWTTSAVITKEEDNRLKDI